MSPPAARELPDTPHHGPVFWCALAIGGGIMAFGVRGVLEQSQATQPAALARWVIGADLVHDLLLAPVAILIGWAVLRVTPRRWRAPVRFGLVTTGITALVGWAPLRGYGRAVVPDNPTVQPLDYTTALLTVFALIWGGVAVWILVRTWRARGNGDRGLRSRRGAPPIR